MYRERGIEREIGNQIARSAQKNCSTVIKSLAPLARRLKLAPLVGNKNIALIKCGEVY